jgi:UDP-N-acetylmuramoyl-tripeptide--D-alanyl-D-alanine ligase
MNPEFFADKLAAWTDGRWTRRPASSPTGFSLDSRRLLAGQMFVALKTPQRDGHEFLAAAAAAGAGAALVSRPCLPAELPQLVVADPLASFQAIAGAHRREFPRPVVGITGSAGKTSTKNLLAALLGGPGTLATEGNLNNHLGVPLTLTRLDATAHRFAVVEAGISGPGEMGPLASMIAPDIAIVTLVAPAHLSGLGDLAGVAREKAALGAAVRPGGLVIFPAACLDFAVFRGLKARTLALSRADGSLPRSAPPARAFFTAEVRGQSTLITVAHKCPHAEFSLRSVSDGMAQNAALALCAALELGIPPETLRARLLEWHPASLRGELHRSDGRLFYVDCYNANPASMADALAAFRTLAPEEEPRLLVVGCMDELGADAVRYHEALGRSLKLRPGDSLVLVGEHAASVREGALADGADPGQVEVAGSLDPVAARLAGFHGSVFVKGSRRYGLEKVLETAGGFDRTVACHA